MLNLKFKIILKLIIRNTQKLIQMYKRSLVKTQVTLFKVHLGIILTKKIIVRKALFVKIYLLNLNAIPKKLNLSIDIFYNNSIQIKIYFMFFIYF